MVVKLYYLTWMMYIVSKSARTPTSLFRQSELISGSLFRKCCSNKRYFGSVHVSQTRGYKFRSVEHRAMWIVQIVHLSIYYSAISNSIVQWVGRRSLNRNLKMHASSNSAGVNMNLVFHISEDSFAINNYRLGLRILLLDSVLSLSENITQMVCFSFLHFNPSRVVFPLFIHSELPFGEFGAWFSVLNLFLQGIQFEGRALENICFIWI